MAPHGQLRVAKASIERQPGRAPARLTFTAIGLPQPKGSTKAFGHVVEGAMNRRGKPVVRTHVTSDNPQVKAWQGLVAKAAWNAQMELPASERGLLTGAVALEVTFFLKRPQSLPKGREVPHTTKPDLDKLLRAVKDALTKTVWDDDAQVTSVRMTKAYAEPTGEPRAVITVTAVDPPLFASADTEVV